MLQSTKDVSSKFTELLTIIFSATEQASEKTDQEVQQEIQSIFRQITASVTFLPMLDGNCTFNVLVYADQDSEVPLEWGDSDAKDIQDAEKVQLRSFSTSNHKVDTLVSYRYVLITDVITCLTRSIYI
jgi:mitotic spindle assembly checkpoint protein MAD2